MTHPGSPHDDPPWILCSHDLYCYRALSVDYDVLSPYSTENFVCVGHLTQMKSTQKILNVHAQRKDPTPGTQRNLYSTGNGVRVGYPTRMKSKKKKRNVHGRRKKFASPNAKDTNMLVSLRQVTQKYYLLR